jgi:hypothetical protein
MTMERDRNQTGYRVEPFSYVGRQQIDWLELMHRQHTIHALLELDVTDARRSIREYRAATGKPLSLTAWIVWCFARALDAEKRMHAYRKRRGQLVVFDDVDITVLVERKVEGSRFPVPHVIRAANTKEPPEIHREIRKAQQEEAPPTLAGVRWLPLWLLLPGFLRRLLWSALISNPHRRKKFMGTAMVTSVGMFGRGAAWGIPLTVYPVTLTVGGTARKPGVVSHGANRRAERIEVREYVSLTLSMDHDLIDGAPAARFATHLKELIENGAPLVKLREARPPTSDVPLAALPAP